MDYSIGVDIVTIKRLNNKLAKKILSSKELEIFRNVTKPQQFLAGRWAVKEAIIKAYKLIPMPSINIIYVNSRPTWEGKEDVSDISISHEGKIAIGMCIYKKKA